MPSVHVLHADPRIVVLDKPPGLSLATRRDEPHAAVWRLLAALGRAEAEAAGLDVEAAAEAAPPLLLVHRLDVGTSGVVVLARDPEAHAALAQAFAERRVAKRYLALVWGHPRPAAGLFDSPLGPDRDDRRRMRIDPAGRAARTRYETCGRAPYVALLALAPETGRTHQIRVHVAAAGHPIVGDDLYGGPRHRGVRERELRAVLDPPHTLLHARSVHLPALRGIVPELIVEAPLPPAFARALAACGLAELSADRSASRPRRT